MAKIRRGGYVFLAWKGDHDPKHVHVYKEWKLGLKCDLDNRLLMKGTRVRRVLDLIRELEAEGRI